LQYSKEKGKICHRLKIIYGCVEVLKQ